MLQYFPFTSLPYLPRSPQIELSKIVNYAQFLNYFVTTYIQYIITIINIQALLLIQLFCIYRNVNF